MAAVEKKAMLLGIVGFTSRIPTLSPLPRSHLFRFAWIVSWIDKPCKFR